MKLLVLTPTKDDTTSFYRAAGVLRNLQQKMSSLRYDIFDIGKIPSITWSFLCQYDGVFFQRPFQNVEILRFVKDMHIPIWVDYDDNLFEIPQANNRAFDVYVDEKVQNNLVEIAKLADIVSVSTKALKTFYDGMNADVRIIPNALNFDLLGEPSTAKTQKYVMWRGGDSHRMDIRVFESEIMERQSKYNEWTWIYAGFNPWELYTKNKRYIKAQDPILYFKWLKATSPSILQVPLHDIFFNRCKSNIAALEGTWAGAVCVVPDWEEWQIPGLVNYSSVEEFGTKLELALNEQFSFKKYRTMAMDYIRENYDLDKVNNLRVQLLKDLL